MAVFTLEDLQSAIEVMVFPKTMAAASATCWTTTPWSSSRAAIDKRDDQPKLIATDVELFEPMTDGTPPLRIQLPPTRLSDAMVDQLKGLLGEFPGESEVFIHLGERQVLRLPDQFLVEHQRRPGGRAAGAPRARGRGDLTAPGSSPGSGVPRPSCDPARHSE